MLRLSLLGVSLALLCWGSVAAVPGPSSLRAGDPFAEEARWLAHEANWGYMSSLDRGPAALDGSVRGAGKKPSGQVASYSDGPADASTGRLWFYIMAGNPLLTSSHDGSPTSSFAAALTISEAVTDPAHYSDSQCGARSGVDPEDPRCAKLTLSGTMEMATDAEDIATGKASLFARHPQMSEWPTDHGFKVFEMKIRDIWMIASYGGGSTVQPADYYKAKPKHHPAESIAAPIPPPVANFVMGAPPPWNHTAARARWLVYNSLWTAVSTVSVRLNGAPWGNIRSVADGVGPNSTGLPFLYLPTPDPTAVDLGANNHATISLSEAAIGARVVNGSEICGNMDAEDPTCGRIHLNGKLVVIANSSIPDAEIALGTRHPNAPWLAEGGAHTGGDYWTMELENIEFLDMYGGLAKLTVADYLAAPSPGIA